MTCELDLSDALDAWCGQSREYPGGMEGAAKRLGVNAKVLRNKLLRSNDTHHLTFEEFRHGLHCFQEARLPNWSESLRALAQEFDHVCIPIPVAGPDCSEISLGVVKLAKEFGDVAREAAKAVDDGKVSRKEVDRVCREVKELMSALAAFESTVKAAAEKGMR